MKIKPPDFWNRFENTFLHPLKIAAQDLRCLIEETLDLIDQHLPDIHTTSVRKSLFNHQPRWLIRSHIDLKHIQPWQQKLLDGLIRPYTAHPDVKAIALSGAASRRKLKTYADLELTVYWTASPSDTLRKKIIQHLGSTHYKPDQNLDTVTHTGVFIDIHNQTTEDTKTLIADVIQHHNPDHAKLREIAQLQHSIPLYGEAILKTYQQQTRAYPPELTRRVITQILSEFRWSWSNRIDIYAPRKALPFFYFLLNYQSSRLCSILLSLNGIYPPDGAAPLLPTLKNLTITPPNFAHRLKQTFTSSPEDRIPHHHSLINDMFDLIKTHHPDIDIAPHKNSFQKDRRTPWDHPEKFPC